MSHKHSDDCFKSAGLYPKLICGFPLLSAPANVNLLPQGYKVVNIDGERPKVVKKKFG